jgi:thiol:disulfide interchange protein DsbD
MRQARATGRMAGAIACLALVWAAVAHAQMGDGGAPIPPVDQLVRIKVEPVSIQAGGQAMAVVHLSIQDGWHINANPPSPDYMIPTLVEVAGGAGLTIGKRVYPAAKSLKLGFDENPIAVFDHESEIRVPIAATAAAVDGAHVLKGTLRFQSCNNQVCLAPAALPFQIAVTVTGGATAAATPPGSGTTAAATPRGPPTTSDTTATADSLAGAPATLAPPPADGFTTAPTPGARVMRNPLSNALAHGGWGAFLTLFLIGLALNLTPCVYPMLGVTVSIFGARRAAPPLQVFGLALVYVLGMATMYSSLGLVAAFTGGLFGSALQSPLVSIGIGVLLIALSLSMFGAYEFSLPPALMARLGGSGTTNVAGVFASGLLVGVFAAPCTGPPIVALLAVVGEKGDPWFGFLSFFTLSLGLGAPYLVLGTFSNLLQRLPRSGDWMVWVKQVFGVVMISIGLFYVLVALAPRWAPWVVPVALIAGGIYVGFLEKSARKKPGFLRAKWLLGGAAAILGVVIVATTPTSGIEFRAFDDAHLKATLASGRPAMLEFSADWCMPCHELERSTFSDRKVIAKAHAFETYRVDLTRYDSPEAERWRRQYAIRGVPTVLFLTPDGSEVPETRVEGFLSPEKFLQRLDTAERAGQRAQR